MLKGIYFDLEDILTWRVSRPEDNLNLTLYGTGDNLTLGLFETGDNLTLGLSKTSGNLAPELIWILHRLLGELIWNRHRLLSKLIGHWIFLKFFFLVWFFLKEMKQANTPKKKKWYYCSYVNNMTHATKMRLNSLATVLATKKTSLNGHFLEKKMYFLLRSLQTLKQPP